MLHVIKNNNMFMLMPLEENFKRRNFMVAKILRPFVTLFLQVMSLTRSQVKPEPDQSRAYWYKLCTSLTISDAEYRTLELLHFLTPPRNGNELPPIELKTLAELRHVTTRTIYNHLSRLKKLELIRSHPLPDQKLQILIAGPKSFNPPVPDHAAAYRTDHELAGPQYSSAEIEELQQALAEIFIQGGHTKPWALDFALTLITRHGPEICARQLGYLKQRCEIFQKTSRGLGSSSAVLVSSIKENWLPPPKPQEKAWYSEEEFNQLIEH